MKKVLIVDDEILVRIGIKSIISWEQHGYCLIGEAGSGNEAIKKIRQEIPDIVLTDLVMEDGDGFELMKQCAVEFPNVRFVVLSGYDDLEHVKKAMKMGAVDYIFKLTLNSQQILDIMNSIDLNKSGKRAQVRNNLFYKNKEAVKSNLLRQAGSSRFRLTGELMDQFRQLELNVDLEKEYGLLYLSVDNYLLYEKNKYIEGDLLKYAIENIANEVVSEKFRCETFDYINGDLVVLIQSEWRSLKRKEMEDMLLKINNHLEHYFNVTVSGSAVESETGIQNIPQQLKELQNRIQERYLTGKGKFFWEVTKSVYIQPESVASQLKNLRDALINHELERGLNNLEAIYEICLKEKLNSQLCRIIYFDILSELKENIILKHSLHSYHDRNGYSLYEAIIKYDFLLNVQETFYDFLKNVACSHSNVQAKYRKEILEVKAYVRENLGGTLTVPVAAQLVCMSDNYFSHVFKKETGISFVDYVNQERIEKAKELLITTDYKIYEISEKVGISSSNYFGILFKRLTGQSPVEYREMENFKKESKNNNKENNN